MTEIGSPLSQSQEHQTILFTNLMAHRCYALIKHLIDSRRETGFSSLEKYLEKGEKAPPALYYEAFLFVYTLIDNLVRYYKICVKMPDIVVDGQKAISQTEAQEQLQTHLGPLVKARNKIQHIDEHIMESGEGSFLGSITWVTGKNTYTVFWTETGRSKSTITMTFDAVLQKHVTTLCYVHNGVIYDLDKAIEILERHHRWLSNTIRNNSYSPEQEIMGIHQTVNVE